MNETNSQKPLPKPVGATQVIWYSPEVPPEYEFQICGMEAVIILIARKDGSVMDGDYTDGKWHIIEIEIDPSTIYAWAYFPKPPDQSGKYILEIESGDPSMEAREEEEEARRDANEGARTAAEIAGLL